MSSSPAAAQTLLNVSYDPTRELYQEINTAFGKAWKAKTGKQITINQSHGGSGKQARSVIDGLEADVVTLALGYDIDAIAEKGKLLPPTGRRRLPNNSSPYTSTIVFVVRKGNPKKIKDWDDLVQAGHHRGHTEPEDVGRRALELPRGVGLRAPQVRQRRGQGEGVRERSLYKNVPVLDSGARGSTTTFAQRKIGDVLIAWENEAHLLANELGKDQFEIVIPVAQHPGRAAGQPSIDKTSTSTDPRGGGGVPGVPLHRAGAGDRRQALLPPALRSGAEQARSRVPGSSCSPSTSSSAAGKAQKTHFDDGGVFDQIYSERD